MNNELFNTIRGHKTDFVLPENLEKRKNEKIYNYPTVFVNLPESRAIEAVRYAIFKYADAYKISENFDPDDYEIEVKIRKK
jgi:hypothetical protein